MLKIQPFITPILIITTIILGGLLLRNSLFSVGDKPETIITHDIVVKEMQQLGKLELVRYKLKDVMEYKEVKRFMPDAKALLIISGEVVGCIDLQKIKLNDITRKEKDSILYIRLPAPELCYVKINHSESRVYNTENTFFSGGEVVEKAYKETEKQIEKAALSSNILEQTKQNASIILKPFLEKIAGRKVVFI